MSQKFKGDGLQQLQVKKPKEPLRVTDWNTAPFHRTSVVPSNSPPNIKSRLITNHIHYHGPMKGKAPLLQ